MAPLGLRSLRLREQKLPASLIAGGTGGSRAPGRRDPSALATKSDGGQCPLRMRALKEFLGSVPVRVPAYVAPRAPGHGLPRNSAGVPSPLRALHPTHSELGGAAKPHSEAPHSRSAAAASGVPSGPRSTCASRSWVAGCGDPGMRATRSPRLPPPGLLPPRATGLQSYSFPRCHGNFLLLIRTKHPPLLAPVGSP